MTELIGDADTHSTRGVDFARLRIKVSVRGGRRPAVRSQPGVDFLRLDLVRFAVSELGRESGKPYSDVLRVLMVGGTVREDGVRELFESDPGTAQVGRELLAGPDVRLALLIQRKRVALPSHLLALELAVYPIANSPYSATRDLLPLP